MLVLEGLVGLHRTVTGDYLLSCKYLSTLEHFIEIVYRMKLMRIIKHFNFFYQGPISVDFEFSLNWICFMYTVSFLCSYVLGFPHSSVGKESIYNV